MRSANSVSVAKWLWKTLAAATAYSCTALISLQFAYLPDKSSLVWLPAGVALGLTYWWGYRVGVVGTVLGAMIIASAVNNDWRTTLISSLLAGLQAGVGTWALRRLQLDPRLSDPSDVLKFVLAMLPVSILSPLSNLLLRIAFGFSDEERWLLTALHQWMGDFLGHLTVGGFLLVWWGNWRLRKREYVALAGLVGLCILSVMLGFEASKVGLLPGPSMVITLPVIVGITFAFQQRGVALATTAIVIALIVEAIRWKQSELLTFPEFFVGWFFAVLSFSVFMTVASVIANQREYARQLEQSRAEIENAYQQVRAILDNAPTVAMQVYDEQGRILFWNRASEQFYGYPAEAAEGKTLDQLIFTPEEQEEFLTLLKEVARTGQPAPLKEWVIRDATGRERVILSSLFPIHYGDNTRFICADIDITERKALEQRLFQAEKLETVGRLAGGIAHDFNNLLTAIMGFAELAQARLPTDHPVQNDLQRIMEASERAANLVRQLLGFARKQLVNPRPTVVNHVITSLMPLLERTLGEDIRISFFPTQEDTTVLIDPTQLEQILMNLAVNARDAMRSKGGGVLTITTERCAFETPDQLPPLPENETLPLGDYVCLSVQDTGEGIPEHLRSRIFDPFFSTKGIGSAGLGLATVYGIVRQNRGFIVVESEVGVGTTFRICLPAWAA